MTNSALRDALDEKHEQNRDARIRWVKYWAEYIQSNPVEDWGPQLNTLVNSQLQSARDHELDAEHYWRVRRARGDRD